MGLRTTSSHVANALRFLAAPNLYMGIGRTTAWADDTNPPPEDPEQVALDEAVCYQPILTPKLLKQDIGGLIAWGGLMWTEVAIQDAYTEGATYAYCEAAFEYDDAPLVTFRQVALFTGLTKAGGAGSGILLPGEVTDPGVLEALDNRTPVVRAIDKIDTVTVVLSF